MDLFLFWTPTPANVASRRKFPEVQRAVPRSALESAPGMRASPLSSFPGCALAARTTFCAASVAHRASTGKAPSPALRPFRLFSGISRVLLHTFGTAHKNAFGTGKLCPSQRRFCKGAFFPQFPFKAFRSRISKGSHAANGSCPDDSSGKLSGPPEMA